MTDNGTYMTDNGTYTASLVYYEGDRKMHKVVSNKDPFLHLSVSNWLAQHGKHDAKGYVNTGFGQQRVNETTMCDHLFRWSRDELVPR